MTSIPIGTPVEYPNLNQPIQQQQNVIVVQMPQQSDDVKYVKKPIGMLRCIAISIIVIACIYPWTNYVLWGTIIAHVAIVPLHITEAVFVLKSTCKSVMYTKFRIHRAVVLTLGIVIEVWLLSYFIFCAVAVTSRVPGLCIFIEMMVTAHFVLNTLMLIEHYRLFMKKPEQNPMDKMDKEPTKNCI